MNNVISIGLFRVSQRSVIDNDGIKKTKKFLDMIFDCPEEYYFSSLNLEVRFVERGSFKSKFFDLSPALFNNDKGTACTTNIKHWVITLPLEKLDIDIPAIYIATLETSPVFKTVIDNTFKYSLPVPYNTTSYEVRYNTGDYAGYVYNINSEDTDPELWPDGKIVKGKIITNCCGTDCSGQLPQEIDPSTLVCSDVNYAYRCMLDDLLKEGRCESISDDAIRKYLLLYGHQAALAVEDMETAETYFKLIGNCFNKCAVKDRPAKHAQPCNCGR